MKRANVICGAVNVNGQFAGAGVCYGIETLTGVVYNIFVELTSADVYWTKSTDGGLSWTQPAVVKTGTINALAVWYDRWSGRSTDKIRMAYTETGVNDILYRDLDTASSDTLGTETTVFSGASAAGGGALTIWVSRHGEIRVAGSIDAGAEDGAWSSTDDGATWGNTIADPSEGATQDQYFGLPGWNGSDTADEMIIFVDASANGLSVKRYDDSANTWTETAIITDGNFTDLVATTAFPNVACAVDVTNSRNIVVAWTATDTANADLRMFFIDDTTITESSANVVLNSTDDQGLCAVGLDTLTGAIYVFYFGKSDGSETWNTALKLYYKVTQDDGATWSAETALTTENISTLGMYCTPRFYATPKVFYATVAPPADLLMANVPVLNPRARAQLGII